MRRSSTTNATGGTPADLIHAAALGARLATRRRLARGQDPEVVRREVIAQYRADFAADGHGDFVAETLMSAVQQAIEQVLVEATVSRGG